MSVIRIDYCVNGQIIFFTIARYNYFLINLRNNLHSRNRQNDISENSALLTEGII